MTNRLRTEIQDEELEQDIIVEEKPTREIQDNLFTHFFAKGFITKETATGALPFIMYIALLGMIYIGNMHLAEKTIRDIGDITKEVKERGWDYKTAKADMAFKSTLTEVAKRADTLGVRQSVEPPQKITVKEDQDGN